MGTSDFDQHTGAAEMPAVARQWLPLPRLPGEWLELASRGVSAVMTEAVLLSSGSGDCERPPLNLGRVRYCAHAATIVA